MGYTLVPGLRLDTIWIQGSIGSCHFDMILDTECTEPNHVQQDSDSDSDSDDNSYDLDCELNVEHDEPVAIDAKKQYNDDKYDKSDNSDESIICSNNDDNDSYGNAFSKDQNI